MHQPRHLGAGRLALVGVLAAIAATLVLIGAAAAPARTTKHTHHAGRARHKHARVLLVGSYRGIKGGYKTIQAAVDAARPGDWILIAPGDYHERADHRHPPSSANAADGYYGGVVIHTPRLHLRGMNRNTVVVDGTRPHRGKACSRLQKDQDFGVKPTGTSSALGRNGIVVWRAAGGSIENLTVCNFLDGSGDSGNEIWWNGGDGLGVVWPGSYYGSYLSATSTYYGGSSAPASAYGIFSSTWSGPGKWFQTYTSNFNDSGYYVGACRQACDMVIDDAHSEFNALGYSGTNAGGRLVVKNSEFDDNEDGFDTNSQNNNDYYSPQDGQCSAGVTSPITHTDMCWVFINNYVHDNNNPNVPSAGSAAAGPVGTGLSISGGRFDTIEHNRFVNNGAWGVIFVPYPDTETPPSGDPHPCQGGDQLSSALCWYSDWGNQLLDNTFSHNGFYGNQTNGDFGETSYDPGNTSATEPLNCEVGNAMPDGSSPPTDDPGFALNPNCGQMGPQDPNAEFANEVACDSQILGTPCSPTDHYPRRTQVSMPALPHSLPTMPNPCSGVPANAWCVKRHHKRR